MRLTGGHEHALGEEAAAVVRQAVSLARLRGHAQVTLLHIASAMLSASPVAAGILRAACVRFQSHPLQHNALNLRLDVALHRLPLAKVAPTASGAAHVEPAPSNAFVVALKRAQAHRGRRGAVVYGKVELEQLVVSILDDPSFDRVMHAAGLSSSQVRASVEGASVSSGQYSRASCDVTPSRSPVPKKARAGGQPSLQIVPELHPPVVAEAVPDGRGLMKEGGFRLMRLSKIARNKVKLVKHEALVDGFSYYIVLELYRNEVFDSSINTYAFCFILYGVCIASKAKSGTGRPAFFGGTEVVATTAILPPSFRHYKYATYTRLTYCGTSLQADAASRRPKFTELTAQNLKILCDALQQRVPRHADIVPGISSTVFRCRSGVTRRRAGVWPTTWLLFRGRDSGGGKTAVARELARLVFGTYAEFTTLQVQGNPDIPARTGKLALKRQRSPDDDGDGNGSDVGARLFKAIAENPHRVILIDGVDRLDGDSEMRIKNAIAGGTMARGCNGDVVGLEDAIVVLSSDVCDSRSVASASSPRMKRQHNNGDERGVADMEVRPRRGLCWDLNVCAAVDGEEGEDSLADDEGVMNVVDGVFLFN